MEQLVGLAIVIIVALVAIISFIGVLAKNYLKAEPNEALIFTGRRHRAIKNASPIFACLVAPQIALKRIRFFALPRPSHRLAGKGGSAAPGS